MEGPNIRTHGKIKFSFVIIQCLGGCDTNRFMYCISTIHEHSSARVSQVDDPQEALLSCTRKVDTIFHYCLVVRVVAGKVSHLFCNMVSLMTSGFVAFVSLSLHAKLLYLLLCQIWLWLQACHCMHNCCSTCVCLS